MSGQGGRTISDGNDVCGDISRDITALSFNDGKSSQTSTTEFIVHLGGTFKQTGVKIKDTTNQPKANIARETLQDKPHDQEDGAKANSFDDRQQPVYSNHHK
jgi:hypothetical protein